MKSFDPTGYGPVFGPILEQAFVNELGPGKPASAMKKSLDAISVDAAFAPHKIVDRNMAACCLSGLWLRFDFLDRSHTISQSIETPTGSYWHGIMHRREPDYGNAKYWFRRVGRHPIFPALTEAAREIAASATLGQEAKFLVEQSEWDAFKFIDLVEAAAKGKAAANKTASAAELCRQVQRVEWELLFEYSFLTAVGRNSNR